MYILYVYIHFIANLRQIAPLPYPFYYEYSCILNAVISIQKPLNDIDLPNIHARPPEMFGSYIKHVYPLRKRGILEEVMSERNVYL